MEQAVALAKRRNPASDPTVFDFVADVLLLRDDPALSEAEWAERCRFVMKFQQLTGPVMAKGVEDTAFYVYNRLVALNEVGGDPAAFGSSVAEFPPPECRTRASLAGRDADLVDPRHQAE